MEDLYVHKYYKYKNKYMNLKKNIEMEGGKINKIKIIPMYQMTDDDIMKFEKITQDRDTMKTIGSGNIWDKKYIKELIEHSKMDETNDKQKYYHYVIKDGKNRIIGYVGMHPMFKPNDDELQVRYFISPKHRGKNYATKAVIMMIEMNKNKLNKYNKYLWSINLVNNLSANRVSEKVGFKFLEKRTIHGKEINCYRFLL